MSDQVQAAPEAVVQENTSTETPIQTAEGELAQQVQEAKDAGASKEEIKQMIKEFELEVYGKKQKVKVDMNDDKYLKQQLQKAAAFNQTAQEKANLEKMIDQALINAKNDPWAFLKELGLDPDDLAERRISDRIEEMKKSPEQVEREKMQKELEEARKQLKKIESEKVEAEMMQRQNQIMTQIDKDITDALANDPELPKSRKTVMRITDALLWAMDNGWADATVADVIPAVKSEMQAEIAEHLGSMSDEMMEKWIGQKNIEKMRKRRLAQAKQNAATTPVANIKQTTVVEDKPKDKREKINQNDFFRNLGK